jgi:hypothetical protein
MHIRIDEADARKRVVTFLREQGYLAAEEPGGILAHPLQSVSERYDRAALAALLRKWEAMEGVALNAKVTSNDEPKKRRR